jgi:hypothetical protein
MGVGVVWDEIPFVSPVIPAKAGIQSVDSAFLRVYKVDSRFRGNDCDFEPPCFANSTSSVSMKLIDRFRCLLIC